MSLLSHRRRATTAQLALLYPGVAPPSASGAAACLGVGVLGSGTYRFDPFREYASGRAGNPNGVPMATTRSKSQPQASTS